MGVGVGINHLGAFVELTSSLSKTEPIRAKQAQLCRLILEQREQTQLIRSTARIHISIHFIVFCCCFEPKMCS